MVFRQLPQAVRHLVAVPLRSFDIKKTPSLKGLVRDGDHVRLS